MAILNGFLRGAHDKEITANVDNKEYAGVATEMYNFIGSKRGGMSKRQPFIYRMTLKNGEYIIPYVYTDGQRYLLRFIPEDDGGMTMRLLSYNNGTLQETAPDYTPSIRQPIFTQNNQDGYVIAKSSDMYDEAYKRFNLGTTVRCGAGNANGKWVSIQYPNPVKLFELSIRNIFKYYDSTITHNFAVRGSNDGTVWETLTPTNTTIKNTVYTVKSFNPSKAYRIIKLEITSTPITNPGSGMGWYLATGQSVFDNIQLTVLEGIGTDGFKVPYSVQQVRELHWANENKRIVFCHHDIEPYELNESFQKLSQIGLDFNNLGNPGFVCFYQERLGLGGFSKAQRQFNLSKSNPQDKTSFEFELPKDEIKSTDAMQFVIRNAKYPLRESLAGRNMIYLQCIDGLATVSSGGDEVPLTPTQVSANLRNHTPFSDIPAVYQEELAFLVGADKKTVYAMDFDYNVMRVRTVPINEHCLSYFDAGIAQMIPLRGKVPYIAFRLIDGSVIIAIAYRTETKFYFHIFPVKTSGNITCIASLLNDVTGFDTLFAVVELENGTTVLESIESSSSEYSADVGRQYFIDNIALDCRQNLNVEIVSSNRFRYDGLTSSIGRRFFVDREESSKTILPDNEIKLFFADGEIICKNCEWDAELKGFWADASAEPAKGTIYGYIIPQKEWDLPVYNRLENVKIFDGDDFVDAEAIITKPAYYGWGSSVQSATPSASAYTLSPTPSVGDIAWLFPDDPTITGTVTAVAKDYSSITVSGTGALGGTWIRIPETDVLEELNIGTKRPIYNGVIGIQYSARAEFENLTDVNSVQYEKEIENISACITYGTGLKLGTESVLEKVGFWKYPFKDWQDRILPDENLKNIPLADSARKDKKIVIECDYPFPANVTFVVYDLKITGVR